MCQACAPRSPMAIRAAVLRVDVAAVARRIHARQAIEEGNELRELALLIRTAKELADLPRVSLRGLPQLVAAGLGQDRIAHPAIARALLPGHEAVVLETVEE